MQVRGVPGDLDGGQRQDGGHDGEERPDRPRTDDVAGEHEDEGGGSPDDEARAGRQGERVPLDGERPRGTDEQSGHEVQVPGVRPEEVPGGVDVLAQEHAAVLGPHRPGGDGPETPPADARHEGGDEHGGERGPDRLVARHGLSVGQYRVL